MSVLISTGDLGERLDGLLSDENITDDDKMKGINLLLQPAFESPSTRFTAELAISKINQKYKGKYAIVAAESKEAVATRLDPFTKHHVIFGLYTETKGNGDK